MLGVVRGIIALQVHPQEWNVPFLTRCRHNGDDAQHATEQYLMQRGIHLTLYPGRAQGIGCHHQDQPLPPCQPLADLAHEVTGRNAVDIHPHICTSGLKSLHELCSEGILLRAVMVTDEHAHGRGHWGSI
jgi:hypothetical protein